MDELLLFHTATYIDRVSRMSETGGGFLDDAWLIGDNGRAMRVGGGGPAARSGAELITDPQLLKKMYVLRRILNPMGTMDAIDFLLDKLRNTKNNAEFFDSMNT